MLILIDVTFNSSTVIPHCLRIFHIFENPSHLLINRYIFAYLSEFFFRITPLVGMFAQTYDTLLHGPTLLVSMTYFTADYAPAMCRYIGNILFFMFLPFMQLLRRRVRQNRLSLVTQPCYATTHN